MSTKIYNGYRIMGSSLDDVITRLFSNKDKITDLIEDKIKEDILSRVITTYYDLCLLGVIDGVVQEEESPNSSAFGKVINEVMKEEENREVKEHNTVDVSICFFPQKQTSHNQDYYLLMLFAGNETNSIIKSDIWNQLNIEEFAYWDNTDPPETLTDYEWEIRDKQWNSVLTRFTPAQSSLILEFKKEYKYNCLYFRDQAELTKMLENNLEKTLLNLQNKQDSFLRYYEESVKDKIAYEACSKEILKQKKIEDLNQEEKRELHSKVREYSRKDYFTEEEKQTIRVTLEKITKIINTPVDFNNLFDKKDVVQENTRKLFKTNKLKM